MGNGELERRLSVCPHTNRDILFDLQELLYRVNPYVQGFKLLLKYFVDFKVIIRVDQTSSLEHRGCFKAPQTDEVAVLIVGQEFNKRDTILRARDNTLQCVNELYRCSPITVDVCRGEDGYCIKIPQVHPITRQIIQNNTVSEVHFFAYRLMSRSSFSNFLLQYSSLLNQYRGGTPVISLSMSVDRYRRW